MERREYIAGGLGVAALLAGGAYVEFGGSGGPERVEPTTVRTLGVGEAAPQSLTVPAPDRPTVLEFFSRTCGECRKQIDVLREVHGSVGSDPLFVSLQPASSTGDVDDPTPVIEMWTEHGGPWPVAIDREDHFYGRFGNPGVPYTVVFEPGGRVAFARMGVTSAADLRDAIRGIEQ